MADPIEDILADFEGGVNSDPPPLKLDRTQLSYATNTTVRGQYARPRPPYNNIQLDAAWEVISTGLFQAALYYKPDAGTEFLLIVVSGDLYRVNLDGSTLRVNNDATAQNATVPQHWMWQAENYVIWNDGINLPVFFDGAGTRRSSGQTINSGSQFSGTIISASGLSSSYSGSRIDPPPIITLTLDAPYSGIVDSVVEFTVTTEYTAGLPSTTRSYIFNVLSVASNVITVQFEDNPASSGVSGWPPSQTFSSGVQYKSSVPVPGSIRELPFGGRTTAAVTVPNPTSVGDSFVFGIRNEFSGAAQNFTGDIGDYVLVGGTMLFQVTAIGVNNVTVSSVNVVVPSPAYPAEFVIPAVSRIQVTQLAATSELPAGKMGAYGMGRNVMALADGKRFIISDIVGASSGTPSLNSRDSVLHVTENDYLNSGGLFTIPGGVGDIRAIKFTATLDVSLGQGPCQIFTPTHVFSVNVPVDRTIWASLTNPILTQTLITNGGLSQNGTINANGDLIFRSVDGIRSLILARRDFATWGNVPMSTEMDRVLAEDQAILLAFCSAIVFDNRLLMTAGPHASDQGVYHDKLIALNFDPVSSLRGKAPSVYDGVWDGIDVLQLVEGMFTGEQRAFAFTRNAETGAIELYELMPSNTAMIYDNGTDRIQWSFETAAIFREGYYSRHDLLRLIDGEMSVDLLEGRVNFSVYYRPDGYPCWVLWHEWDQCAQTAKAPLPIPANADTLQVQFRPRMGLGEPRPSDCDPSTNRPTREGYYFQLKFVITGHCRALGSRYRAAMIPQPKFAPPICCT